MSINIAYGTEKKFEQNSNLTWNFISYTLYMKLKIAIQEFGLLNFSIWDFLLNFN